MIDAVQSRITLWADLDRIPEIIRQEGWSVEPWPVESTTIFVMMQSDIDKERYVFRIVCENYPDDPPSIKCVDPATKDPNMARAWPRCDGFRPPPTADLCLNISREGLKQLHPDWQKDPRYAWESSGNPIWCVLAALQDRLNDRSKYHGRTQ